MVPIIQLSLEKNEIVCLVAVSGILVIFPVFYVVNLLDLFFPMFSLVMVKWALTSLVGRFEAAIHNVHYFFFLLDSGDSLPHSNIHGECF